MLEVDRGRLKLELTGNGPRFDGKTVVAITPELQTRGGEVVTAEKRGDLPGLGEWRE